MSTHAVQHALILAAGRGTRMKELTQDIPKPMLPVAGTPVLERIIKGLQAAGIDHFTIITGYRADVIENHFGDGSLFDISTVYVRQEIQNGTAQALCLGRQGVGSNPFVLAWGDILIDPVNYPSLVKRFISTSCDGLLGVNWVEDPFRGAAVYADKSWRIERIEEKPPCGTATTHWNNAGIGVFRPLIFDYAARVPKSARGEFEIPDAISAMMQDHLDLRAFALEGLWTDVGTPTDLKTVESQFSTNAS